MSSNIERPGNIKRKLFSCNLAHSGYDPLMHQHSYTTTQTWADGVTPDLILHIVDGDWLGEPEDSCLWSTIGTPVCSPLDAGGYRSHVDDIASHLLLPPLHAFRRRKIKGRWFATDLWSHRRHTHCTERINTGQTCKIFIEKKKSYYGPLNQDWFTYHSSILCIQAELHICCKLAILVKDKLFTSVCVVHKSTDWVYWVYKKWEQYWNK